MASSCRMRSSPQNQSSRMGVVSEPSEKLDARSSKNMAEHDSAFVRFAYHEPWSRTMQKGRSPTRPLHGERGKLPSNMSAGSPSGNPAKSSLTVLPNMPQSSAALSL
eukprot:3298495-Prymnesium_polylepis.1